MIEEIGGGLPDFLDINATEDQRQAQIDEALRFAQLHMTFVDDKRASDLLQMWKQTVCNQRIPVGSPLDAYAAAEAVRAFVYQIDRQVEIARSGKVQ